VATTTAVGAVLVWSTVIAPKLVPDSYESQLMSGGLTDPVASVRAVLRTLLLHGDAVLVFLAAVAITVVALGLHARLVPWQVWALLASVAASPLAALAYASNTFHLNDPERVGLPVGVLLWIVACSVAGRLPNRGVVARGVLAVVLLATVLGGVAGYLRWTAYASAQQELLTAVEAVRVDVPDDATVIVEDTTGRYGDVYLLLPPHLNYALDVEYGAGADGVLCTAAGVPRDQPDAAIYPIATTPDCSEYLAASTATYLGQAMTDFGLVRFHLMR
jgi:4-amino-4-deoxy-L-arabinose transferase-like glycosyltransferase